MKRGAALAVVLASAACFATLAVLAVLAYEHGARPLPLLVWRFSIASVLMAAYLAWRRPGALGAHVRFLPRYAALSLSGYGAASICFFFALQHASASVVAVLLYTYPALVSLASVVLHGERLTLQRVLALAATFAGCVLVVGLVDARVQVSLPGVLLGLGAAVGYATFSVLSSKMVAGHGRLVMMTYTFGLSAIGVAFVTVLAGESLSPAAWSPALWLLLAMIVAVPTFAAVVLYLQGLRVLGAPRAAIASTAEPVFTIALAAVALGERLTSVQSLGALLVVAGIALAEWPSRSDGVALV